VVTARVAALRRSVHARVGARAHPFAGRIPCVPAGLALANDLAISGRERWRVEKSFVHASQTLIGMSIGGRLMIETIVRARRFAVVAVNVSSTDRIHEPNDDRS
jgi:hypothetical protein